MENEALKPLLGSLRRKDHWITRNPRGKDLLLLPLDGGRVFAMKDNRHACLPPKGQDAPYASPRRNQEEREDADDLALSGGLLVHRALKSAVRDLHNGLSQMSLDFGSDAACSASKPEWKWV